MVIKAAARPAVLSVKRDTASHDTSPDGNRPSLLYGAGKTMTKQWSFNNKHMRLLQKVANVHLKDCFFKTVNRKIGLRLICTYIYI